MKSADELSRENEALRNRISILSDAVLRISASLDVDTVLSEIAENARALTGARGAVITAFDHAGQIDYVTSGLTPDQERELFEWPDGLRLFEHLRNLPSPLRLPDLPAYVRSLGFSTEVISVDTFLATSIRHRDVQAGVLLRGREGRRAGIHQGGRGDPGAVRGAGGDGDRERARAPRRAARPGRPGGPDRHLAGGRRGDRCQDRAPGVAQQGGKADRRRPARSGPDGGRTAAGGDLPARRRAGGRARRVPADDGVEQRRAAARRRGRAVGA